MSIRDILGFDALYELCKHTNATTYKDLCAEWSKILEDVAQTAHPAVKETLMTSASLTARGYLVACAELGYWREVNSWARPYVAFFAPRSQMHTITHEIDVSDVDLYISDVQQEIALCTEERKNPSVSGVPSLHKDRRPLLVAADAFSRYYNAMMYMFPMHALIHIKSIALADEILNNYVYVQMAEKGDDALRPSSKLFLIIDALFTKCI